jgi:NifB/MoaA-like Fe-S oxidoreductase
LVPRLAAAAGLPVRLVPVRNEFFGGNIGVTGLLTGADVGRALAELDDPAATRILLPDVVLSRGRFLDGIAAGELPQRVEIVPTNAAALVHAVAAARRAA